MEMEPEDDTPVRRLEARAIPTVIATATTVLIATARTATITGVVVSRAGVEGPGEDRDE